jgi:hypothetical protein
MDSARDVISCHLPPETRVQNAYDDVASTIHQSLGTGAGEIFAAGFPHGPEENHQLSWVGGPAVLPAQEHGRGQIPVHIRRGMEGVVNKHSTEVESTAPPPRVCMTMVY